MAAKTKQAEPQEDLYMMVSPKMYRASKSGVLRSQADLLGALKRIHNLQVLARQKRDLKRTLHKLLASTLKDISKIQEKLPEPKVPKEIKQHKKKKEKIIEKVEPAPKKKPKKSSFREDIDAELQKIQDKLKQING